MRDTLTQTQNRNSGSRSRNPTFDYRHDSLGRCPYTWAVQCCAKARKRGIDPSSPEPLQALPVTEKTYLFKELYTETIIRNPKKVGLFGYRYTLNPYTPQPHSEEKSGPGKRRSPELASERLPERRAGQSLGFRVLLGFRVEGFRV